MVPLDVRLDGDTLMIGDRLRVSFQRTLRIPDDGRDYPLPPGLGALPVVPGEDGHFLVPMYQREALWLAFGGAPWRPNAVKVGLGMVNAVTGAPWTDGLADDPQDYLVCPGQPWLDGIVTGAGRVRQFVAMPLGTGHTVEEQLSSTEAVGGVRIAVYEPKPGRFPDAPPEPAGPPGGFSPAAAMPEMGLGAGGRMRQRVYADRYGVDTWDIDHSGEVVVHILNRDQFREVTGREPPPSPVDARTYTEHGLPWFELYDEDEEALEATAALERVRSVDEVSGGGGDGSVEVDPGQIRGLRRDGS